MANITYNPYGFWNYYGAYAERMKQYRTEDPAPLSEEQKAAHAEVVKKTFANVKPIRGDYDSFTVSEEIITFPYAEKTEEGYWGKGIIDFTKFDRWSVDSRIVESDDPFWKYTGGQYLVFSEELYKSGFYHNMTDEEVEKSELLLAGVTYTMDSISRFRYNGCTMPWLIGKDDTCYWAGFEIAREAAHINESDSYFPRSYEAGMDLEASVTALHYFAENYIEDEELRNRFSGLIDDYYAHNLEVLGEYVNLNEVWEQRQARWFSSYGGGALADTDYANYCRVMATVTHTEEETQSYVDHLRQLFGRLDRASSEQQNDIWEEIRNAMLNYATGGSNNQYIRKELLASADTSFRIMEKYWAQLLKVEK